MCGSKTSVGGRGVHLACTIYYVQEPKTVETRRRYSRSSTAGCMLSSFMYVRHRTVHNFYSHPLFPAFSVCGCDAAAYKTMPNPIQSNRPAPTPPIIISCTIPTNPSVCTTTTYRTIIQVKQTCFTFRGADRRRRNASILQQWHQS